MNRTISAALRRLIVAAFLLGASGQAAAEEYYYAVEVNGVLCGYAKMVTSPLEQGGRALTVLRHDVVIRGTLLGAPVDNRIQLVYHIDPATGTFTYHESLIEVGQTRLTSAVRVEGRTARVSDGRGGAEKVVELPEGVVLANTLAYPHLLADFVGRGLGRQTYQIFDGRDNAVREAVYTRTGAETLSLGGKSFDTVVLDSVDRTTGVTFTVWLDTRAGITVQTRQPGGGRTYLTDASVVEAVTNAGTRADLTSTVMTKANLLIRNVRGISYMKVRAVARPTGLRLTPESLSVPGQRFSGRVQDNLVEGVFEIEHPRYDGAQAPPFPPPDYSGDPSLRPYLEANDRIQADDAVLRDKAREITASSRDSWDAARRLSQWVAKEIKGAIPGGITARGTFDQRAGECGGHSFLMAAFSRGVGIPARVVWGVLYVPDGGGAFGRHGWNEVYMGAAGWIPLDTTVGETDYVDSGHVRIGVFQASVATSVDLREIEILEHRVTPAAGGHAGSGQGPARFDAYIGEYKNTGRGITVKVSERDGALVADIPGQIALTLKEPDADGVWRSTTSDQMFVTFRSGDAGRAVELWLHQIVRLRRTGAPAAAGANVPADLQPYLGTYLLAQAQAEFTVAWEDGGLVLHDPLAKKAVPLKGSGKAGTWVDPSGRVSLWFEKDQAGTVTAMLIDGAMVSRR